MLKGPDSKIPLESMFFLGIYIYKNFIYIEAFSLPKEFSPESSFESTSYTQTETNDPKEKVETVRQYKHLELVWTKQIYMPWFPG